MLNVLTSSASPMRSKPADALAPMPGAASAESAFGFGHDPAGFASLLRQSRAAPAPLPPAAAQPIAASTEPTAAHAASMPSAHLSGPHGAGTAMTAMPTAADKLADHAANDGAAPDADAADSADDAAPPAASAPRTPAKSRSSNTSGNAASRRATSPSTDGKNTSADTATATTASGPGPGGVAGAAAIDPALASLSQWAASLDPALAAASRGTGAPAGSATVAAADGGNAGRLDPQALQAATAQALADGDRSSVTSSTSTTAGADAAFARDLAAAAALSASEPVRASLRDLPAASNDAAAATAALNAAAAAGLGASAGTAPPTTVVTLATPVDSPDFSQALGLQMSLLAKDGVQSAELHLNPAEMGPVSVQITMDGSQAHVSFGADLAATRHAIEAGLPELASALRDAGFTLAGGGVSQHAGQNWQGGQGGQGGPAGQNTGQPGHDSRGANGRSGAAASNNALGAVGAAARRIVTRGGLDLYA